MSTTGFRQALAALDAGTAVAVVMTREAFDDLLAELLHDDPTLAILRGLLVFYRDQPGAIIEIRRSA